MDNGIGEEVAPLGAAEGGHFQSKDGEYFLKPESSNVLESREIIIPGEGDYSQGHQEFAELLDGKNIRSVNHVNALERPYNGPCSMDGAGDTVQELTVRNFDGSNLAIFGSSTNIRRVQTRQNQWQHLYQLASGSGSGGSRANLPYRDNGQRIASGLEDGGYSPFPEFMAQKPCTDDHNDLVEELTNSESRGNGSNAPGNFRTKILSKSGFSEYFVKNTLKGKGVVCKGPANDGCHDSRERNKTQVARGIMAASDTSPGLVDKIVNPPSCVVKPVSRAGGSDCEGVNLREWLKSACLQVNKVERLNIFKQIVELVDCSHTKGIVLHGLRPSYFKLQSSNKVKYIGSPVGKEILQSVMDQDLSQSENSFLRERPVEQNIFPSFGLSAKKPKFSQNTRFLRQWLQFPINSSFNQDSLNASHFNITGQQDTINEFDKDELRIKHRTEGNSGIPLVSNPREQLTFAGEQLEEKWYMSPEELNEGSFTTLSNIYCLGVFLFELLAHFDSDAAHATSMSDLRHRILPPSFLSENYKEAGFCLWLLHPEPSSRPTTREILQSEVFSGLQEAFVEDLSSSVEQDDAESELLMHFLSSLNEQKRKDASKLVEDIRCLEADIEEVKRRQCPKEHFAHPCLRSDSSLHGRKNGFYHKEPSNSDVISPLSPVSNTNESRLIRNIGQLESAYFSMRSKIQLPETDATARVDKELLNSREIWSSTRKDEEKQIPTDRLGAFFEGLCKYARFSKFEVCGVLRNGEFNSSSNVICSLSFDRDEDYFATAGVSKKIKIFEFNALLNNSVDIHYPVIEMPNKSKLSCVSWNNYIKNYLASTDYDGAVKLWDASTGQSFSQYNEHEKRAWSVDFSPVCPTKLASGSDDCSVKLWSVNEKNSLGTIRNIANVCCVQFSPHSTNMLAFGSADYRTYCYDLRYAKAPWCVLAGHDKAVSYVKFLDSETLVSASTDNTLKIWDLNKSTSSGPSTNACSLTLSGHTNEKNFVGLSISDGYIVCGSETNEVYAYYKTLPMPITSHKFGSIDSISGKETDDDNGQFVSSVCWRGKSDMVVAANSTGCIKVLQML
ncbi:hypothetical protein UlMin_002101 [Ulmus minor]